MKLLITKKEIRCPIGGVMLASDRCKNCTYSGYIKTNSLECMFDANNYYQKKYSIDYKLDNTKEVKNDAMAKI